MRTWRGPLDSSRGGSSENRGAVRIGILRWKKSATCCSAKSPPRPLGGLSPIELRCASSVESVGSEHQLHAPDHFVELILAKFGMRLAEIRPGVDVIDHQLDIVAADVVVEPAGDGMDTIVALLPGV